MFERKNLTRNTEGDIKVLAVSLKERRGNLSFKLRSVFLILFCCKPMVLSFFCWVSTSDNVLCET